MEATYTTARLTEREKEALRLWLDHRTAKEIALDLGISHHAVEKRLKMARTKLGAASSLEAARMLADAERTARRYQQTVTGPADLPSDGEYRKSWQHPLIKFGGIAMLIVTTFALVLAATHQPVEPIEIEVDGSLERVFALLDEDESGFLEKPESPFLTVEFLDQREQAERHGVARLGESGDPKQIGDFYAAADKDGDDRISFREYDAWSKAHWAEMGIEISTIVKVLSSPGS